MDKTLKEKLGIVELADVEALFDALAPSEKIEFISKHVELLDGAVVSKSETVDVFGEEQMVENVSDETIADYALEHKQVLKLIFARIVKEDRIK